MVAVYTIALASGRPVRGARRSARPARFSVWGCIYAWFLGAVVVPGGRRATGFLASARSRGSFTRRSARGGIVWPRIPRRASLHAYSSAALQEAFLRRRTVAVRGAHGIEPRSRSVLRAREPRRTTASRASRRFGTLSRAPRRRVPRRARLAFPPSSCTQQRSLAFGSVELAMRPFASSSPPGARRSRSRPRGGSLLGGPPRGYSPAARRFPPLPRGASRARRVLARLHLPVAPYSRLLLSSSPSCRRPDVGRALPGRPHGTRGHRSRAFAVFGGRPSIWFAGGSAAAGALVEERSVRLAFGCGSAWPRGAGWAG